MKMNFTRQQVAKYVGYDRKTLYTKIVKVGIELKPGRLSIDQVHFICEQLGYPKPTVEGEHLRLPKNRRI